MKTTINTYTAQFVNQAVQIPKNQKSKIKNPFCLRTYIVLCYMFLRTSPTTKSQVNNWLGGFSVDHPNPKKKRRKGRQNDIIKMNLVRTRSQGGGCWGVECLVALFVVKRVG